MTQNYHPTANQAAVPLTRLLDNETKEINGLVEELRERAANRSRLEIAIQLMANAKFEAVDEKSEEPPADDEKPAKSIASILSNRARPTT